MMKKKSTLTVIILCLFVLLTSTFASAEVKTTNIIDEESDFIYVAGNPDFYPIEFYNKNSGKFEGVMPEILALISKKTGLKFAYVNSKKSQTELANNLQVEMISGYVVGSKANYASDIINIFSYDDAAGKNVNIGLAFTFLADEEVIETIRGVAKSLTDNEVNRCFVTTHTLNRRNNNITIIVLVMFCAFFIGFVVFVWLKTRKAMRQLEDTKMMDDDTGIGNYSYFKSCFDKRITDYSRKRYYLSYFVIDNNFLQLYHSESIFSEVVKYTANVLAAHSNASEFSARITESGFALAFQVADDDDAKSYIENILEQLDTFVDNGDKTENSVFRVAIYNLRQEDYNCELLLFNLRKNCNKILGTDTKLILCDAYSMNSAAEEKKLIESFENGFKNKEFKLFLQFIVDNKTKKITSAEALSRWQNPERGLLTPYHYISHMEAIGMIAELDFYMFETVCRQLHKWRDTEFDNVSVSCNFTRITLSEENFLERIKEISSRYVFDRSKLVIEITEDAIEKNRETALKNVFKVKELGFVIALDDLGSGYTSLSNMCDYPIDIVKLDRDILLKAENENGKDLFNGIISLIHSLNKKVVCEGVETEEQNTFVGKSDCDYIQGWYYSKPLPSVGCEKFYFNYQTNL